MKVIIKGVKIVGWYRRVAGPVGAAERAAEVLCRDFSAKRTVREMVATVTTTPEVVVRVGEMYFATAATAEKWWRETDEVIEELRGALASAPLS